MPTLPGTNFCGPFNSMKGRKRNSLDKECYRHDKNYIKIGNKAYFYYNWADRMFLKKVKKLKSADLLESLNEMLAEGYFTAKHVMFPSSDLGEPVTSDLDLPSNIALPNNKRVKLSKENFERIAGRMDWDSGLETRAEMKAGTPDCVGTIKMYCGEMPKSKEKWHRARKLFYEVRTSGQNECGYTYKGGATLNAAVTLYADQIKEVYPIYGALGAAPTGYGVADVDYTAGSYAYLGSPTRGKMMLGIKVNYLIKVKNNSGTTVYFDTALYRATSNQNTADGVEVSLINKVINKTSAEDDLTTGVGLAFNKSLLVNMLNLKTAGTWKREGRGRATLKPGQYVWVDCTSVWKGDPYDPKFFTGGSFAGIARGDCGLMFRQHGDIGDAGYAVGDCGTLSCSLDMQYFETLDYVLIASEEKKKQYVEFLGSTGSTGTLQNRNPDNPAVKAGP